MSCLVEGSGFLRVDYQAFASSGTGPPRRESEQYTSYCRGNTDDFPTALAEVASVLRTNHRCYPVHHALRLGLRDVPHTNNPD